MTHSQRFIALIVSGLVLSFTSAAFAQDWAQWRGVGREGKVTGFTPPETWPKELKQKWKEKVGLGDSSPALVGDKLYVFTRISDDEVTSEVTSCRDAATGKEIWSDKYKAQAVTGAAATAHSGPRSSPAVADGMVVTIGVGGVVSCLDAAFGKVQWRKDEYPKAVPKFFSASSPMIVEDMVIAQVGGEGKGAIIAFDLKSGEVKWKWSAEGPGYSSPVIMEVDGVKQVVAMTEKSVVGVSLAEGKLLWQIPFVPEGRAYNAATPIVDGSTVYITGQGRGTKALKIEKKGDGFTASELWSNDKVATQFNTPVLKDGYLYGLNDQGFLFCMSAKDGKVAWTDSTKRGGAFAAIVDAGSVILAMPNTSELIAFKPDPKEYAEVAKIKVADTPTYAYPIIAGKNVYVKDQDSLTLWSFE